MISGIKGEVFSFIFLIPEKKNNFKRYMNTTNVEQSKELVNLGIRKESADCQWWKWGLKKEDWKLTPQNTPGVIDDLRNKYHWDCTEAWSLDALVKLLLDFNCSFDTVLGVWTCTSYREGRSLTVSSADIISGAVELIKWQVKLGFIKTE